MPSYGPATIRAGSSFHDDSRLIATSGSRWERDSRSREYLHKLLDAVQLDIVQRQCTVAFFVGDLNMPVDEDSHLQQWMREGLGGYSQHCYSAHGPGGSPAIWVQAPALTMCLPRHARLTWCASFRCNNWQISPRTRRFTLPCRFPSPVRCVAPSGL